MKDEPDKLDEQVLRRALSDSSDEVERTEIEQLLEADSSKLEQLDQLTQFSEFKQEYLQHADESAPENPAELKVLMSQLKSKNFQQEKLTTDADLSFLDQPIGEKGEPGRLGDYEIMELVARGGMGVVLKGRDPHLNRIVAIKALAPEIAAIPKARELFLAEARAAAALDHTNILPIHAVHPGHDTPYFVMPFVNGPTLQEIVDRVGSLSTPKLIDIGKKIARGLTAAHAAGIIHRDIKPANILLDEDEERVWIADFGVAQAIGSLRKSIAGTPQFMAPEQADGKLAGTAADLYSLGKVLEFAGGESKEKSLPKWLERLIASLTQNDTSARPESASVVAALLKKKSIPTRWPWMVAATACAFGFAAIVTLACNPRGFIGGINQTLGKINGQRIWVDGQLGTFRTISAALEDLSGSAEIIIEGDARLNLPPLQLPEHEIALSSAPNAHAELHQTDPSSPLITSNAPLTLRALTLHRDAEQRGSQALIQVNSSTLTIEGCELITSESKTKPFDLAAAIELRGTSTASVKNSMLVALKSTAFRLPPEPRAKGGGGAIEINLSHCVIGGNNLVTNLNAPGRSLSLNIENSFTGLRSVLMVDPKAEPMPTKITANNSALATSIALVWIAETRPREPLPWLDWQGDGNFYSHHHTYTRFSNDQTLGSAPVSPKSIEAWNQLPWVSETNSEEIAFRVKSSSSDDRAVLRKLVIEWIQDLKEISEGKPSRGPTTAHLPFLKR